MKIKKCKKNRGISILVHYLHICICVAIGIDQIVLTKSIFGESLLIDFDYSQRLLLNKELEDK